MSSSTAPRTKRPATRKRAGHKNASLGRENAEPLVNVKSIAKNGASSANGDSGAEEGSLVQQAIHAVANYLHDQGLRPGDTLPGEKYFADELGVSRAVMREAFGALGALQIIDIARGRKPKVSPVDGSLFATSIVHGFNTSQIPIMDVWEVRKTVEIRAVELAATVRTEEELAEIQDIVEAIVLNINNVDKVSQYNAEFHYAIARASHNVLFAQILASFSPITRVATREAWRKCTTKAQKQAQVRIHKAIVRAIARKDPSAAANAMRKCFDEAIRDNWSRLAAHRFSFDDFVDS